VSDDGQTVKRKAGWSISTWLGFSLVLLVFVGLALPSFGPQTLGCQIQSASQMKLIGVAAEAYRTDHGAYPKRLSQLAPEYISPELFCFRCRYGAAFVPANADKDLKLIDAFSAYEIQILGDGRALIFERLPMWSDQTIGFYLVPQETLPTGSEARFAGGVQLRDRLPREEFAKLYSACFGPKQGAK
jgi:hypothetical protein